MSERALRDEIETLHAAILQERAKLAVPLDAELSQARAALQTELEALTGRLEEVSTRRDALVEQTRVRKEQTREARAQLSDARSEIGSRESLGNPLGDSRSTWEDPDSPPGCGAGLSVLLSVAALAAAWWMS